MLPISRTARGPHAEGERHAGALYLLAVASGLPKNAREHLVADGLAAAGWRDGHGEPLTSRGNSQMMSATSSALQYAGFLPQQLMSTEPEGPVPLAAVAIARAALGG